MAVQFAGSGSTGDRRRRRIVVSGEGADIDPSLVGEGADIESQLVASAAAGPWVPVSEFRIWIYAALIGVVLGLLSYAVIQPRAYRAEVRPLTDLLFNRSQPLVMVVTQVLFLGLSALLGHLIGWYRSRGKLDFAGRYRFWPWASALFGLSAFCLATGFHRAFGQMIDNLNVIHWRPATVGWLLPTAVVGLPIVLFLDRDIRHCRSCLWTIRTSIALWIGEALLEIYRPELRTQSWFALSHTLIPVFASATLFLGLWLHARIVAYVCPDPPELDERTAWSQLMAAGGWLLGAVAFWRKTKEVEADEVAPKRRRKKADTEEATTKRKRKAPAKKSTSRSRTRTKPVEEDVVEEQAEEEVPAEEESEANNEVVDETSTEFEESVNEGAQEEESQEQEQWEEEAVEEEAVRESRGKGRYNQVHRSHGSSAPAPHSRRQTSSWEEESGYEESARSNSGDSDESDDEEQSEYGGSRIDPEQMKGLSKRQKRELKKQLRDQERARGR